MNISEDIPIRSLSFAPFQNRIVYITKEAHGSSYVKIVEIGTGTLLNKYAPFGHHGSIKDLSWNHEGTKLATGSWDGTVKIWNTENWTCIRSINVSQHGIRCIEWSPTDDMLAIGTSQNQIYLWDDHNSELSILVEQTKDYDILCVAWSPDGQMLAWHDENRTIIIWDLPTKKILKEFIFYEGEYPGTRNENTDIEWSPKGGMLATISMNGLRIWNTSTWVEIRNYTFGLWIEDISWKPDSRILAISSYHVINSDDIFNRTGMINITIMDTEKWDIIQNITKQPYGEQITWNEDGSLLTVTVDDSGDGMIGPHVNIIETNGWECIRSIQNSAYSTANEFSPGGTYLAIAYYNVVSLWMKESYFENDSDNDGYSDGEELQLGSDPLRNESVPDDIDGDGWTNYIEFLASTDSHNALSIPLDTDNDSILDYLDDDRDGDGYYNEDEVLAGSDPDDRSSYPPDMDGDYIPDLLDNDRDGDKVPNEADAYPDDPDRWELEEEEGVGKLSWWTVAGIIALLVVIIVGVAVVWKKRATGKNGLVDLKEGAEDGTGRVGKGA